MNFICVALCFFLFPDLESSTELQEKLQQGDFLGDPVDGSNFGLQHFTYDNDVLLENIFDHLAATSYNGIVVCCF